MIVVLSQRLTVRLSSALKVIWTVRVNRPNNINVIHIEVHQFVICMLPYICVGLVIVFRLHCVYGVESTNRLIG